MRKITFSLLTIILMSTLVFASHGPNNITTLYESPQEQLQNRTTYYNINEYLKIGEGSSLIKTKLQISNEGDIDKLQVKLGNGRNVEIKIMPEVASETVLKKLKLKNCDEMRNCIIELKEVGEGENTKLVYEARVKKTFRLFGLFKSQREVITQIDAESGEEILTIRPWWSWMTSEEDF